MIDYIFIIYIYTRYCYYTCRFNARSYFERAIVLLDDDVVNKLFYYIDNDEISGFFLLLKNHIFIARSEDTIFIFHVRGYWGHHGY